jgi:broad specificity phosphatase PhoE
MLEPPRASDGGWCLAEQGKDQAVMLGALFQQLGIVVSRVVSSPLCRNIETSNLAFGEPEVIPELSFIPIHHGDNEMREHGIQEARDRVLALLDESREGNSVAVEHGNYLENLDLGLPENLGDYFEESDVVILKPKADSVEVSGHMTLTDWANLIYENQVSD